ncbi:histidinol-phosphate aminotransferase family protein [Fibrella sp. HMF5335]|uniref:Histidinol-phosphate aminotransferase family protein n=1 Tax=Fibrella rubiginis TaxID=2817060 RepID=A0A939GIX8_9BACT|nr:histidinol-phosphate transaminase [Fibrella rubiginis]MBO0937620.1 histidinol-phosphate aminotransferase family protein [Fibrella rubiginis]
MQLNRRDWLRAGLLAGVGAATAPAAYCEPWLDKPLRPDDPTKKSALKARLLANENPYGPSPAVLKTINEAAPDGYLYAMEYAKAFKAMVAKEEGVPEECVLLGAGSGELLNATAMYFAYKTPAGNNFVYPDPTFDALPRAAIKHGMIAEKVPLVAADGYDQNLQKLSDRVTGKTSLVYLCNPNNPTAILTDPAKLRQFISATATKTPVFVDEAYIDYVADPKAASMVDLVRQGQNVIISRTFSKVHGFAGLRIGYLLAKPELIAQIAPFSPNGGGLSMTSLRAALVSMPDKAFIEWSLGKTAESKAFLDKTLKANGYTPLPSSANFVMFPIRMKGEDFVAKMMDQGVGIRQWKFDGQYWCRVSLGTMPQMQAFADGLKTIS